MSVRISIWDSDNVYKMMVAIFLEWYSKSETFFACILIYICALNICCNKWKNKWFCKFFNTYKKCGFTAPPCIYKNITFQFPVSNHSPTRGNKDIMKFILYSCQKVMVVMAVKGMYKYCDTFFKLLLSSRHVITSKWTSAVDTTK
jgi:hypothetical protein